MIYWTQITGFEWDHGNARKSAQKLDVSHSEAEQAFFNQPLLVLVDKKHSYTELRYYALGKTDEIRLLHITFTLRAKETLIRVISARNMHRKEKIIYEQSQKNT